MYFVLRTGWCLCWLWKGHHESLPLIPMWLWRPGCWKCLFSETAPHRFQHSPRGLLQIVISVFVSLSLPFPCTEALCWHCLHHYLGMHFSLLMIVQTLWGNFMAKCPLSSNRSLAWISSTLIPNLESRTHISSLSHRIIMRLSQGCQALWTP